MNLNGRALDEWLRWAPRNRPGGREKADFARRYDNLVERLRDAHRVAVAGAALADAAVEGGGPLGLLTDHGEDHVQRVIARASNLLSARDAQLTPREVFMLLVAIQLHDVGNAFGRAQHEEKVLEILPGVRGDDLDAPESRFIAYLVQAHGGKERDGSKDRIGRILPETDFFQETVRLRLLAAILRFADELAEDYTRASRFLLTAGGIPRPSEVYHRYADSLRSVSVDTASREIRLRFSLSRQAAIHPFGKDAEEQYLLDEILHRTHKMHYERIYCMRFMAPHGIALERIRVEIQFFEASGRELEEFHDPIAYTLENRGYPREESLDVICPGELLVPGTKDLWTGEALRARVGVQNGAHDA